MPIVGATAVNYVLDDPDVGSLIRVVASYTDGGGTPESLASAAVGPVTNVVDHILIVTTQLDVSDAPDLSSIDALLRNKGLDGRISLREAIIAANNTANAGALSPDEIRFDIPGASHRIDLTSALPTITDAVVIDGTTEPDSLGVPIIELNGTNAGPGADGFNITAGGTTIRGFVINRFRGDGIDISGAGGNTIIGNWIGLNSTGTLASANTGVGIRLLNTTGNTIGGGGVGEGNVISGNTSYGMHIQDSDSNAILGNRIGTDAAGTVGRGNVLGGIWLENADNNVIGGATSAERNLISGNGASGVRHGIVLNNSDTNLIQGNYIGTDVNGDAGAGLGNFGRGLEINAGSIGNSVIGNVISASNADGVVLWETSGNVLRSNLIGTNAAGTVVIGNGDYGVWITDAANNTIGGFGAGDGNVIAGSGLAGIEIDGNTSTGNAILGNSIYASGWIGIDLYGGSEDSFFVTANDPDPGLGPNDLQNFPY